MNKKNFKQRDRTFKGCRNKRRELFLEKILEIFARDMRENER